MLFNVRLGNSDCETLGTIEAPNAIIALEEALDEYDPGWDNRTAAEIAARANDIANCIYVVPVRHNTPVEKSDELDQASRAMTALFNEQRKAIERLMSQPENQRMLKLLHDAYENCLCYLANYATVIDHSGKPHAMVDVSYELSVHMRNCFTRLTGQQYEPKIVRQFNDRKQAN